MAGVLSSSQAWEIWDRSMESDEEWVTLPESLNPLAQVIHLFHLSPANHLPL